MARGAIEQHERRDEIDAAIRQGTSTREVCRLYGIKHQTTVARYAKRLRAQDEERRKREAERTPADERQELMRQARSLFNAATSAVKAAHHAGRGTAQIVAQKEARATLAMIGRLMDQMDKTRPAGADRGGPPAHEVQATLIKALDRFPEARDAVVEALTHLEAKYAGGDRG